MKRILLLSMTLWCCLASMHPKTYMVAVGLADYPGTKNDLTVSDNDAITMKNLYEKYGQADAVLLLNDSARQSEVIRQMKIQFGKASDDDTIILFFGGHGMPGAFICYDQELYYGSINKIMMSSRAKNKIVFADACYSGKARKTDKRTNTKQKGNIMFFLSSRTNEKSMENRKWHNGYFTGYLERGLRGGADFNKDRKITALELFQFVSEGVKEVTRDRQHPVMWGNFDHDMPIMVWR